LSIPRRELHGFPRRLHGVYFRQDFPIRRFDLGKRKESAMIRPIVARKTQHFPSSTALRFISHVPSINGMPWSFLLIYMLSAVALLLGVAASPLAARRVGARTWWLHAMTATCIVVALTVLVSVEIYGGMIPWWQVGAAYVSVDLLPVLAAGWGARAAVRRWSHRGRLAAVLGGLAGLVTMGAVGVLMSNRLMPDVINAVR
jgi:hypothetical protein